MFPCSYCEKSFKESSVLLSHFTFYHADLKARKELRCFDEKCTRTYNNFKSFGKHILSHTDVAKRPRPDEESHVIEVSNNEDSHMILIENDGADPVRELSSPQDFDTALANAVVTFLASLYDSDTLTEAQIQKVVDSHKQLLGGGFLVTLKTNVLDLLNKASNIQAVSQKEINEVCKKFDSCQNMFSGFDSSYLRFKEFEKCGSFIKPEPYVIGHATDEKNVPGRTVVEPIALHGQYIPLRKVLKGFLELPGVFQTVATYQKRLEDQNDGTLQNIVQGSLWKEKIKPKFAGKCVMPGLIYFDEYEPNKELGTHTGSHKMAALYSKLVYLPPEHQGSLDNIFLANLFHSGDRAFGNNKVFRKTINELKYLEDVGITVVTEDGPKQVYFAVCLAIGDILGANAILGFVESFSANFYCRVCREPKGVMQQQLESNPDARRSKENHKNDVKAKNPKETGVKEDCCFNVLDSFHNAENFHLDLMHDLDEGAWNYDLCAIIGYFLRVKRFDLEVLNNLIQGFYFGPSEQRNKPPIVSKEHIQRNKLACSASEMRCLTRYFGLIVGHLLKPEDADVWNHYLLVRKIIDIVTAPKVPLAQVDVLRELIKQHHSSYIQVFHGHLVPKMHFMVHYPDIIPLIGPLEPLSCVRFEGKHKEGKQFAHVTHNRVNLPYSIAKKHQLKFCFRLLSERGLPKKVETGPIRLVPLHQIKDFCKFSKIFSSDLHVKQWNIVQWVSVNGRQYCVGTVLTLQPSQSDPQFGQIHTIFISKDGSVNFLTRRLKTLCFDHHFHAYKVEYRYDQWHYLEQADTLSDVSELRIGRLGVLYVALRHAQF